MEASKSAQLDLDSGDGRQAAAGVFDRPLLLTPKQDIVGFARSIVGKAFLTTVASLMIVSVLLIFVFIIVKAWPFFMKRGFTELLNPHIDWYPEHAAAPEFGATAMLFGSGIVTVGAMIIAVPVGLAAAVFLSDICAFKARQFIKPIIEILAAIPSVAYGFFAVLVVAPWLQKTFGIPSGTNALNAAVMLAVMAVPTIVSISEDAISSVGRELREGGYALGSTRAEVMLKVVIPAAHSGIIAAVILGFMRAVGETMLVWMASGMAKQIPTPWWDMTASVRTLTATIAQEMSEAEAGGLHRQALFSLGLMLLVITFMLNLASEFFLSRARRPARGKAG